jgi:hypothetical protein
MGGGALPGTGGLISGTTPPQPLQPQLSKRYPLAVAKKDRWQLPAVFLLLAAFCLLAGYSKPMSPPCASTYTVGAGFGAM